MVSARVSVWASHPPALGICVWCYCCVFGCWMFEILLYVPLWSEWYRRTYQHSLHVLYFTARGSIISRAVSIFYRNVISFATHCTLSFFVSSLRLLQSERNPGDESGWSAQWGVRPRNNWAVDVFIWVWWRSDMILNFETYGSTLSRNSVVPLWFANLFALSLFWRLTDQYNWHRFL